MAKFGRSQLKNPTPASWAFGLKLASAISGIITAWLGTATFIPDGTRMIVMSILGLVGALLLGVMPLIGVEVEQSYVKKDSVTEMETPPVDEKNKP